jgi:hypothetical protein
MKKIKFGNGRCASGIIILVAIMFVLQACSGTSKAKKSSVITFQEGNCEITELVLRDMMTPSQVYLKENEKAFSVCLNCTGIKDGALPTLYSKGQFVAPDGKTYKAGASITGVAKEYASLYVLIVAVPKDLDVGTLNFVFDRQNIPLKPFIKK